MEEAIKNKENRGISRIIIFVVMVFVFFLGISLVFTTTSSISFVYFLFGILAIFSALIYMQIHLFYPERRAPALKEYPSLAILVPNYNSEKTIVKCLDTLFSLKYPKKFEIFLIDDGSKDKSLKLIGEYLNANKNRISKNVKFKLIRNERNLGKATSLNKAMKMTNAEVIACVDSDTYPREDVLLKMVPYLYIKKDVIAVTGFIIAANPKNLLQRVQELEYYGAFGFAPKMMVNINGIMVIPGPLSILKRKEIIEIGGYDETNLTEDMEIGLRIHRKHYSIEYCPDAIIPTEVPDTLHKLYKQRIRWYRGTISNLNKYKEMMFNPNYQDFGVFSYPSCLFYVIFTILTFAILVFYLARDLFFRFQIFLAGISFYSLGYLKYMNLESPIVFNSSFLVFFFVFLALWLYYFYYSVKQAKAKITLKHLPAILSVVVLYPTLISVVYIMSFVNEFLGRGRQW